MKPYAYRSPDYVICRDRDSDDPDAWVVVQRHRHHVIYAGTHAQCSRYVGDGVQAAHRRYMKAKGYPR